MNSTGPGQRLRRSEELLDPVDAQHPGSAERRLADFIGPRECSRRGGGRPPVRLGPTRLDHQHGLVPRRPPRRRHELAGLVDRLQVEQDRCRRRIAAQVVEHVARVDVGTVSERDEMREADLVRTSPVEHRRAERAGLRDEGEPARQRVDVGEGRVQAGPGHHETQAVGPQDPQQVRSSRIEHPLLERSFLALGSGRHARCEDHHGPGSQLSELLDEIRDGRGRGADHREVGRDAEEQRRHGRPRRPPRSRASGSPASPSR